MKATNLICVLFANLLVVDLCLARAKHPVLLISCDGFRADKFDKYLNENPNSNFRMLVDTGVKADFMK